MCPKCTKLKHTYCGKYDRDLDLRLALLCPLPTTSQPRVLCLMAFIDRAHNVHSLTVQKRQYAPSLKACVGMRWKSEENF